MQNIGRSQGQEPFGRAASIDFDKLEIEGYGPFRHLLPSPFPSHPPKLFEEGYVI